MHDGNKATSYALNMFTVRARMRQHARTRAPQPPNESFERITPMTCSEVFDAANAQSESLVRINKEIEQANHEIRNAPSPRARFDKGVNCDRLVPRAQRKEFSNEFLHYGSDYDAVKTATNAVHRVSTSVSQVPLLTSIDRGEKNYDDDSTWRPIGFSSPGPQAPSAVSNPRFRRESGDCRPPLPPSSRKVSDRHVNCNSRVGMSTAFFEARCDTPRLSNATSPVHFVRSLASSKVYRICSDKSSVDSSRYDNEEEGNTNGLMSRIVEELLADRRPRRSEPDYESFCYSNSDASSTTSSPSSSPLSRRGSHSSSSSGPSTLIAASTVMVDTKHKARFLRLSTNARGAVVVCADLLSIYRHTNIDDICQCDNRSDAGAGKALLC